MSNVSITKNYYPSTNPLYDFIKMMQDQWYNFAVNCNQTYIQLTEATYDFLCNLFCDLMKPMVINMARQHAKQLEEQRRRQRREIFY